jgi:hypothetical protein
MAGHRLRGKQGDTNELHLIQVRLEALQQLLLTQQRRITDQETEIERLKCSLSLVDEVGETTSQLVQTPSSPRRSRQAMGRPSRRTLLRLGGVTAAAGITVAAAAAGIGNSAPIAYASGTAWQTGTVDADVATVVVPASSSYASLDILQLQLGTGTAYSPLGVETNAAKAALAAYDTTTDNIGVYATSSSGFGLFGVTDTGTGATGAGLNGSANGTGTGVSGFSQIGIGVQGNSTSSLGGSFSGGQAPLALGLSGTAGSPGSGTHIAGELYLDSTATLFICITAGAPGTWVKMAHLAPGATSGGAITYLSKPIRLLDTRSGATDALFLPGAPYAGGSTHAVTIAGDSYIGVTVPSRALGAMGNVTVVNPAGSGYIALVPHGAGFTGTAILAYSAGQIVSNSYNVGLSSGQLDIIIGGSTTDVILDLFAVVS